MAAAHAAVPQTGQEDREPDHGRQVAELAVGGFGGRRRRLLSDQRRRRERGAVRERRIRKWDPAKCRQRRRKQASLCAAGGRARRRRRSGQPSSSASSNKILNTCGPAASLPGKQPERLSAEQRGAVCARWAGPAGGGDLAPALWSGARTRCTLHGPETCANTALSGTDARQ